MADTKEQEAVVIDGPYKESDDHVPNPTDVYGTLDTSGTAGAGNQRIEDISPIFEVAKNDAKIQAARALDPDDDGVDESSVVFDTGTRMQPVDIEAEKDRVKKAAKAVKPVKVGDPQSSPSQAEAAEKGSEKAARVEADRKAPAKG